MTLTRWPGKPTSGRYVYASTDGWFWQCDLHRGETADEGSYAAETLPTMQAAFAQALAHAATCTESSDRGPGS